MINPIDFWAPVFRAPFSGDVTQEITPRVFSPDIKGVPMIEHRVQTEVASYGKQLGKILEALQDLGNATGTDVSEIDALVHEIEEIKSQTQDRYRIDAEDALSRLRQVDQAAWENLIAAQKETHR